MRAARIVQRAQQKKGMKNLIKVLGAQVKGLRDALESARLGAVSAVEHAAKEGYKLGYMMAAGKEQDGIVVQGGSDESDGWGNLGDSALSDSMVRAGATLDATPVPTEGRQLQPSIAV